MSLASTAPLMHSHASAQQNPKRAAEHTNQAADQAALPGVGTIHCSINEAIHDRELIILLLNDYSL